MARVKISEYRAKSILTEGYKGVQLRLDTLDDDCENLDGNTSYVVKVDQGVKKRRKQGLIKLNVPAHEVESSARQLSEKGFNQFVAEPMLPHEKDEERYVSFERTRDGWRILYNPSGGIDVEDNTHGLVHINTKDNNSPLKIDWINFITQKMDEQHLSFLEINPLIEKEGSYILLDAAALADDAGAYFATAWSDDDIIGNQTSTPQEEAVAELDANSPAALKLKILNKNGSIWPLFSGGGASITIADEIEALEASSKLGAYGEYSGGPSTEETYLYTKSVLELLIDSDAPKKALLIAGGVANFTDIKKTFAGIIQALGEALPHLDLANFQVFVRRGGPNEQAGLRALKEYLDKNQVKNEIAGSDKLLTVGATKAVEWMES